MGYKHLTCATMQADEVNIYENAKGVVTVTGLKTVEVKSEAEALKLLFEVGHCHDTHGG